jgi:methyl-accepting chemotaxis protein
MTVEMNRSARGASHRHDGFFAYHGVWAPGIRLFRQLHFGAKAAIISMSFLIPMLALTAWLLADASEDTERGRRDALRHHVEIAHSLLRWSHAKELSGELTREQAQKLALEAINQLRYEGTEYFFISDMVARIVVHPIRPELNGTDARSMVDPFGVPIFVSFVDIVKRQGAGFSAYQWARPGSEAPVDKLSYVSGFEPWGWVLGTGFWTDDLRAESRQRLQWAVAAIGVALSIAGYLFFSFYRVMDGGMQETRRHLRRMTDGDLSMSPNPWGNDEAAELMRDLGSMQNAMRHMVTRVRESSDQIVQSTQEIATGSQDLSMRTEQAAANLEESAAAIEEISATAQSSDLHMGQAVQTAQRNAELASAGGQSMQQVVGTMDGIRGASSRIAEIIGTIDGIAFQTNILALNAAVEAARAGEQGRGFAVVATEVRLLAQRSATAAREIRSLIEGSVQQIEGGVTQVHQTGTTIEEIVQASRRVNQLLQDIAEGSREQATGMGQVGIAVQDLDRVTQQNAALVEQTSAAASALRDQAQTLADEVARFRLPGDVQA